LSYNLDNLDNFDNLGYIVGRLRLAAIASKDRRERR
jgi:hypothetical protein